MPSATAETGLLEEEWLAIEGRALRGPDGEAGSARLLPDGWRSWLLGPAQAIHEAGEQPLVFTLRRCWTLWPRWLVEDSEGERVGTVGGPWLLDRWDEPAAQRGADGTFHSKAGALLARWDGRRLEFAESSRGEPFLRMLLLAAVLAG